MHHKSRKLRSVFLIAGVVALLTGTAYAANVARDMLVYRGTITSVPVYRTHDGSTFSSESSALSVSVAINNIKVVSKPGTGAVEKVMCATNTSNDVYCQVYNGASWGNSITLSTATGGQRAFDLAYESVSGRAVACYRSPLNTQMPYCAIWDGSSWGTPFTATATGSALTTMRLISDPNSNYIALITRNGGNDLNTQIWNGSSFSAIQSLTANGSNCAGCLSYAGAWEGSSGDFVAGWFDNTTGNLQSKEFNKTSGWVATINNVITSVSTANVWIEMASRPFANDILVAVLDGSSVLRANHWSGSNWDTTGTTAITLASPISGTVSSTNHLFDIAYEQRADYDAVVAYGSTASSLQYRVWDTGTNTWGTAATLPTASQNATWLQLASDPKLANIMLTLLGSTNIGTLEWNGNAWDPSWTAQSTASNDNRWNAWFAYDKEDENDHAPSIVINSAAEKTNGSGLVDISVSVSDVGLDNAKLKVEYGACDGTWQNAAITSLVSATYGTPDISGGDYQIGTNTPIVTNPAITGSSANTLTFLWDSKTDLANGNATYCLRFTGHDGVSATEIPPTTTLMIDNVRPAVPTDFQGVGTTSSIQHLNWTSASDTNFNHYEFWYGTDQTKVEDQISSPGEAVEFGPADFPTLNNAATYHAHIMELDPLTTYHFALWAVDDFGNETMAMLKSGLDAPNDSGDSLTYTTLETDFNATPISAVPTDMEQVENDTRYVTFSARIYDIDLDDVLMRVRFATDADGFATFNNANIVSAEVINPVTDPEGPWDDDNIAIDNTFDFQVGKGNPISLNEFTPHEDLDGNPEGAVLLIIWDTKASELNGFAGDVKIQVTPMDINGQIGSVYTSAEFEIDDKYPTLTEIIPVPQYTNDATPSYTFNSNDVATLEYDGSCNSSTTSISAGNKTITLSVPGEGTYDDCTITATDDNYNSDPVLSVLHITPFVVDTTLPTGLASLAAGTSTTTTQQLTWNSATDANFDHYEIWYGTNQPDVENRAGSAKKWSVTNDVTLGIAVTTETTISGLTSGTTYSYKIWAADIAGNEATISGIFKATSSSGGGNNNGGSGKGSSYIPPPPLPIEQASLGELINQVRILIGQYVAAGGTLTPGMVAFLETSNILAPSSLPVRDLQFGMIGEDVRTLQRILIDLGYAIPSGATSRFLWETQAALSAYQRDHKISPAVGMFGPVTRAYMKEAGVPGIWW